MVDFQSRDTRRGPTTDDEDETADEDPEASTEDETADDETVDEEQSGETETEAAGQPESPGTVDPERSDDTEDDESGVRAGGEDVASDTDTDTSQLASGAETATAAAAETTTVVRSVDVAVVTVGTDGDRSVEDAMTAAFEAAGHEITVRERLHGEYDTLQQVADRLVSRSDVDVVVTAGGVGITADEVTIEAVHPLLEKALPGFGEAFRTLLYDRIGTGIVAVRSAAGVAEGTLVFCLPGDAEAAQLAVEEILVTEAPELVAHLEE
jgi:molybdenum cofactor biosynthesis protein B